MELLTELDINSMAAAKAGGGAGVGGGATGAGGQSGNPVAVTSGVSGDDEDEANKKN